MADASPQPRRGRRTFHVAIAVLLLLWCAAMVFRMQIRAQWWAHRLTHAQSPQERSYYVTRLASIGNTALPALPRVLNHPDDEVRRAGVAILHYCPANRAQTLLLERLHDRNEDVAAHAALELSLRNDSEAVVPALRKLLEDPNDPHTAMAAAVALERIGGPDAGSILIAGLRGTEDANLRAQIIDSLGILGSRAAAAHIERYLTDHRPVTCLPASQRNAERAIAALSGDLAGKGIDVKTLLDTNRRAAIVSAIAERTLRLLTTTMPASTAPYPNPSRK